MAKTGAYAYSVLVDFGSHRVCVTGTSYIIEDHQFGFRQARAKTPMLAFACCVAWGKSLVSSSVNGSIDPPQRTLWGWQRVGRCSWTICHPLLHPASSLPWKSPPPPSALHLHSPQDLPSDLSRVFSALTGRAVRVSVGVPCTLS